MKPSSPGLGRHVVGLPGIAGVRDDGRDVHDSPVTGAYHRRNDGPAHAVRAAEIRLQDEVPVLLLHPQEQVVAGDTRVVHEDRDSTIVREHARPRPLRPIRRRATSRAMPRTRPRRPRSRAARSAASRVRAVSTTCAPAPASALGDRAPIPREPPVTSATWPSRTPLTRRLRRRRRPRPLRPGRRRCTHVRIDRIRRTSPASTRPGPTSTNVSIPSATIASTSSCQRTGDATCRTSAARAAAPSRTGRASTLAYTGTRIAERERREHRREALGPRAPSACSGTAR